LAQQDLKSFIADTMRYYQVSKTEYDTRAFSVGLAKKVRRKKIKISEAEIPQPHPDNPIWWVIVS
jgi:hypothetical protein